MSKEYESARLRNREWHWGRENKMLITQKKGKAKVIGICMCLVSED